MVVIRDQLTPITFKQIGDNLFQFQFTPDGTCLAVLRSTNDDNSAALEIWDIRNHTLLNSSPVNAVNIYQKIGFEFSPDGTLIILSIGNGQGLQILGVK